MNAIILSADEANQLETINRSIETNRVLRARALEDGRMILNADVLDDPFFADGPWGAILKSGEVTELSEEELAK